MARVTYDELMQNERTRAAIAVINAAYVSDALDRLGIQRPGGRRYYLPPRVRYLCGSERDLSRRVFGVARTASFRVVSDPSSPEYVANPYAGEIAFIRALQPGDVAVIHTPAGETYATEEENERKNGGVWGGLLTALAMSYGALGAVIDGPIRDVHQIDGYFRDEPFRAAARRSLIAALGDDAAETRLAQIRDALRARGKFPIFGTGTLPTDSAYRTEAITVSEPIQVGGVGVRDGDFVVADADGQVVIPNGAIRDVLERVLEIDEGDRGVWADALTRLAGFHDDSIDEIVQRHGGHL